MKWINENDVKHFIESHNYDIRLSRNGRWIDQKCTPDVITIVADCVLAMLDEKGISTEFCSVDVWHYEYTMSYIPEIFKKPDLSIKSAKNEYDKFFSQPLEMLAYSGVLTKKKEGNRNIYTVVNVDILRYLSLREMNSLHFLCLYCEKVLKDSEFYDLFLLFFENPNKNNYLALKTKFIDFCIKFTRIEKKLEPCRIFPKILNPLAFKKGTPGSIKGYLSKKIITYDILMYNRENMRDIYSAKPKNITRQEHDMFIPTDKYSTYLIARAKRNVRLFNDENNSGLTEVYDDKNMAEKATHIHHIFAKEEFPSISNLHENLIALTPTQHLNYAHINGNTRSISVDYQYVCLMAKIGTIRSSYELNLGLYEFYKFMDVLNVGLSNDLYLSIEYLNFDEVINQINKDYNRAI